ncbi:hypothetical protein ACH40D_39240 [Streptomyces olivaceoviridis]|uniref:Uncharacterized protein n=1 Tax=Streptomyces olivaceoviridis TaxID=1921 RepID=A0ABW7VI65_STROI|nr:hypothetical protein [Streptomyces corchorusii]
MDGEAIRFMGAAGLCRRIDLGSDDSGDQLPDAFGETADSSSAVKVEAGADVWRAKPGCERDRRADLVIAEVEYVGDGIWCRQPSYRGRG